MLVLAKTKFVARLLASDFPSENPRTQASNFPYTKRWQTYKTKKPKKIMIKILTSSMFLFFLTVNLTFGQNDPLLDFINKNKDKSPGNPISVSAIQLISTPEKYDGKVIRVIGYLNLEFEGTALYCYKSDFENRIYKNSIWLEIPKKEYMNLESNVTETMYQLLEHLMLNKTDILVCLVVL